MPGAAEILPQLSGEEPGNGFNGDLSPTDQVCPKGSVNPPCRCVPQGALWFLMLSLPIAPALTARAITSSGWSTNNSTRAVVVPISFGLSKRFFTGWCRKNGAPSISRPATEPMLHNKRAPSAFMYQPTAVGVSGTANMTEIIVLWVMDSMMFISLERRVHRISESRFACADVAFAPRKYADADGRNRKYATTASNTLCIISSAGE